MRSRRSATVGHDSVTVRSASADHRRPPPGVADRRAGEHSYADSPYPTIGSVCWRAFTQSTPPWRAAARIVEEAADRYRTDGGSAALCAPAWLDPTWPKCPASGSPSLAVKAGCATFGFQFLR
jgi:hypothetical protein